MGGSQNVFGNIRTVSGIGPDKAARIAYYALTNYTNYDLANTNFNAVRANTIASAAILYGMCSNEYLATCRAWYVVNVGSMCYCNYPILINWPWIRPASLFGKTTGLNDVNATLFKISLFPNPAKKVITINAEESELNDNSNYSINIYDIDGKLMYSSKLLNLKNTEINIENLPQGIYQVNVKSSNWNKNLKFVKI